MRAGKNPDQKSSQGKLKRYFPWAAQIRGQLSKFVKSPHRQMCQQGLFRALNVLFCQARRQLIMSQFCQLPHVYKVAF
jgi:hypothetical protein